MKKQIILDSKNMDILDQWCTEHNVSLDAASKLISDIIGYQFDRHPQYSKIKNLLNKGFNAVEISKKLKTSSITIHKIINMYDDLHALYKGKSEGCPKIQFTKKQKLLMNLNKYGINASTNSHYIPKFTFHVLPYNQLLKLGMSPKFIEKYYKELDIVCIDKDTPPSKLVQPKFLTDVVQDIFCNKTYEYLCAKYGLPRHQIDSIIGFFPSLALYRKEMRRKLYDEGFVNIEETTVPLRNLVKYLNPKCGDIFNHIPSTVTIPAQRITCQDNDILVNITDRKTITNDKPIVGRKGKEQPAVNMTEIEIYYMFKDGVPVDFICKKFKISEEKAMDIYNRQKIVIDVPTANDDANPDVDDRIIHLYAEKYKTIPEISKELNVSETKIKSVFRNNKISARSPHIDAIDRELVLSKFREGHSIKTISGEFGVQPRTIRNIIEANIGKLYNDSNMMVYHPKLEMCNWSDFELILLESDMTDEEIGQIMELPKTLIKNKRKELKEANNAN